MVTVMGSFGCGSIDAASLWPLLASAGPAWTLCGVSVGLCGVWEVCGAVVRALVVVLGTSWEVVRALCGFARAFLKGFAHGVWRTQAGGVSRTSARMGALNARIQATLTI